MASHGNVLLINNDAHFRTEFEKNSNKLVVVDFTASWQVCVVHDAVFLKVDVDNCREAASSFGIRAMPTFLFFLHGQKVDEMKGADPETLRDKIQQWAIQSSQPPVDSAKVATGRQLDCFRELLENSPDMFDSASQLLLRIANNIVQEPDEPKYRTLKQSTNTFENKLLPVKGAVECLFAMGFVDKEDQVVLEADKSLEDLKMIRDTLLDERNKREVLQKTMHRI